MPLTCGYTPQAAHSAPHTFGSKMDAGVWLAQERALVSADDWVAPGRRAELKERLAPPTFGEYAGQWLADRSLKPRTREGYEHLLRRYLDSEFGDLPVPDLTPAVVRRWWAGLSGAPDGERPGLRRAAGDPQHGRD